MDLDDTTSQQATTAVPQMLATLVGYAVVLLAGVVGLVAALDHGCAWGWALAALALLSGIDIAERLADVDRAQRQ